MKPVQVTTIPCQLVRAILDAHADNDGAVG